MGPTVPWKQHVKWRATRLISAESGSSSPCRHANTQSAPSCRDSGAILGAGQIYETLLRTGKAKKTCTACNRHLNTQEMLVFENYVRAFDLPPTELTVNYLSFHSAPRTNETNVSGEDQTGAGGTQGVADGTRGCTEAFVRRSH